MVALKALYMEVVLHLGTPGGEIRLTHLLIPRTAEAVSAQGNGGAGV
jgi:hypothetical protein